MVKPRYTLELFMEQGSEGAHWCAYDNTLEGYEGLISLVNGDHIQIINKEGHILWDGIIDIDTDSYRRYYYRIEKLRERGDSARQILAAHGYETIEMSNQECEDTLYRNFSQPIAGGYACHWTQRGVDPDDWAMWFRNELEVRFL